MILRYHLLSVKTKLEWLLMTLWATMLIRILLRLLEPVLIMEDPVVHREVEKLAAGHLAALLAGARQEAVRREAQTPVRTTALQAIVMPRSKSNRKLLNSISKKYLA